MSNILFIAFDYPPILSPEAIQVQRRALTLAENGHNIFILTAPKEPSFEFIDNSLLKCHKNIEVINTNRPSCEKLFNYFFKLIDITDRKFWWQYIATKKAERLITEKNIDTIYTHSTPLVDHLVGCKLKKKFSEIKWIAHFSDPWSMNPYKNYKYSIQKKVNIKLESEVCNSCDLLTVTSSKTKKLFARICDNKKISVLPHTFDASTFKKEERRDNKLVIVHTGNIYGLRTIKYFLLALREVTLNNIEFRFYGKVKKEEENLVKEYGLEEFIKIEAQVSYLESLKIISNADYLMVIDAPLENSPFFPSKLADYIGAQKPIIALTSKTSTTVDILKNINNNQYIANSNSIEEIKSIIKRLKRSENINTNLNYYSMLNYNLLKEVFEK